MASSPEAAPSDDEDSLIVVSPPAPDTSISPSPPSPPLESKSPPIPASPPPLHSSPPPPPTPESPPPSKTPTRASPPDNSEAPPSLSGSPPPEPDNGSLQTPPAPALARSSPPSSSTSDSSHPSPRPVPSSSSSDNNDSSVIIGIIFGVAAILVLIYVCVKSWRNKKQYFLEHGLPVKGDDQYHKGSKQQKKPGNPMAKLPPTPGAGGWGVTPPQAMGNTSSELSPSYLGKHPVHLQTPSPNVGGFGAKCEFTYEALAAATDGFSQANLLGQGGFGFVHKGVLPNGKEVAVKSLKSGSGQGEREFQAEVEIISRVHHRHLVSLVGYCIARGQRMLVYEFVPNNTLEFHLHGKDKQVMDWASRRRIAVGSAKGLAYLHEDCCPRIIHRDIKGANILLDFNFEAMVADFGLAKFTSDNYTHVSTRVMGTFGYLAPEYAASGKLSEKSDVISFGVMLLELITGRRPIDPANIMEDSLVDWARPLMTKALETGDYSELVDPRLEDKYVPQEMARMIDCAAACIRQSARRRPRMSQIKRALDGDSSLEDLNGGAKEGESRSSNPYDTGAYNADIMKFKKMVMSSEEFNSGTTSEYGLNQSSGSSNQSREMDVSPQNQKQ